MSLRPSSRHDVGAMDALCPSLRTFNVKELNGLAHGQTRRDALRPLPALLSAILDARRGHGGKARGSSLVVTPQVRDP